MINVYEYILVYAILELQVFQAKHAAGWFMVRCGQAYHDNLFVSTYVVS